VNVDPDCRETSFLHLALAGVRRYAMMCGMLLLPFSSLRVLLMRLCGVTIGRGCYVGFNVAFDTCYPSLIRIGSHATISHNVTIVSHTATPATSRLGRLYRCAKPVVVGDGAWIAANSLLLPGVEIGRNCMIGAGSVVTASTEPDSLYAGNPARKIKSLSFPENPL
jgi:acetyltransferase-like isoleucine patch superfamily enzyme